MEITIPSPISARDLEEDGTYGERAGDEKRALAITCTKRKAPAPAKRAPSQRGKGSILNHQGGSCEEVPPNKGKEKFKGQLKVHHSTGWQRKKIGPKVCYANEEAKVKSFSKMLSGRRKLF